MASNGSNGGGWLGAPKKLWSSITSEVSNIFTEPQHATNKYEGPLTRSLTQQLACASSWHRPVTSHSQAHKQWCAILRVYEQSNAWVSSPAAITCPSSISS